MPNSSDRTCNGFVLLEVLIAFAIAILALSVMIEVAGGSLRAAKLAAREQEATVRAQSRLAEVVHGGRLIPGEHDGDDGEGYHWRVRIIPMMQSTTRPDGQAIPPMALYGVTVWIAWKDGAANRDVRLDSETMGPPPP